LPVPTRPSAEANSFVASLSRAGREAELKIYILRMIGADDDDDDDNN
jgi:hypothetical protein